MISEAGGDLDREALSYIKDKIRKSYFEDTDGQPWRYLHYVLRILVLLIRWWGDRNRYQSALSFWPFPEAAGELVRPSHI